MTDRPDDGIEPLITECPNCQTRFRVAEAQLQQSRGRVRCGACLTVFDGVQHLAMDADRFYRDPQQAQEALDALLDELAEHTPAPRMGQTAPAADAADASEQDAPEPEQDAAALPGSEESSGADEAASAMPDEAAAAGPAAVPAQTTAEDTAGGLVASVPETATAMGPADPAEPPAAGSAAAAVTPGPVVFGDLRPARPLVWLGIVAGMVLLLAQILWYRFDDWGTQPMGRAVYRPLCAVLGCALPLQRDTALLSTRNLAVRSHPEQPGRLRVDAVIVNEAPFAQPFPELELRFTTVHGNLVAGHRLTPEQYLAGDAAGMTLIPPRTPVRIELAVDDPGGDAVNYFLRFR